MKEKKTVLAVDDEIMAVEMLEDSLESFYRVITATSAAEAMQILQREEVDLILCDQRMPKQTGIEFLTYVKDNYPKIVRILLTGYSSLDDAIKALNNRCLDRYLSKPWEEEDLLRAVDEELRQKELELQNERLKMQLMQSAYHHQILIDTMSESYVSIDVEGKILQANNKVSELLAMSPLKLIDSNLLPYLKDPKLRKGIEDLLYENREQTESILIYHNPMVEVTSRAGATIPMELVISSLYFRDNLEFICFFHDIREAIDREKQLKSAKEEAEAASDAKSIFLAEMSHELRTPLHSILSYAEMCEIDIATLPQEKLLEAFQIIRKNGHTLLGMIDNVLDLAKMESGAMDYTFMVCDLVPLVNGVVEEMKGLFESKGLDVTIHMEVPEFYAEVDHFRVKQVLRNLLGNSVKFSPNNTKIDVTVAMVSNRVQMKVEDEGPGIPQEEINTVFDHFQQSSVTKGRNVGTGLGLSICHEIVTEHGGQIDVRNRPEGGLVCLVTLPLIQGM